MVRSDELLWEQILWWSCEAFRQQWQTTAANYSEAYYYRANLRKLESDAINIQLDGGRVN